MERIKLNQFYQHSGLTDHFDQLHIKEKSSPSIYFYKCHCPLSYFNIVIQYYIE